MEKLLTVVIPAYNAERYIKYTLDSLCSGCRKQAVYDHSNELEILIVDDGSTDGTGDIADQYADKYPEVVRVIHKENGGQWFPGINCGIQEASGRYMKVVDADDWVDEDAFHNPSAGVEENKGTMQW